MKRLWQHQPNETWTQFPECGLVPRAGDAFDGRSFSGRMPMA